jgi:hypothetical protein
MNKLSVMAWMSLDGVFDAELMGQWWAPYDSAERAALSSRSSQAPTLSYLVYEPTRCSGPTGRR